jgi:hypothetical protein
MLCNAQTIEIEKVFGGYKYTQNGEKLKISDLESTFKNNTKSLGLLKKAKTSYIFSSILNFSGGFLIGYPLGQSLSSKDANWTLAGIGAGLSIIGITISSRANKKVAEAVELHNSSLKSTSFYEFKVIGNQNGIGLSLNF